jgi:branched-chain amino acid transport system ATP-binding protein
MTNSATATDDIILSARALTKRFAGFVAVNGVDLSVKRGSIHALIGPNGAGKTTCFNLLTKFLQPTSGTIRFNGRDITALAPAAIARLGIVRSFQISAVFPRLTVLENVRIALQRRRGDSFDFWRAQRVLSAFDPLPMRRRENSPTGANGRSRSQPPSRWNPRCCCSTSRWPAWRRRTWRGSRR